MKKPGNAEDGNRERKGQSESHLHDQVSGPVHTGSGNINVTNPSFSPKGCTFRITLLFGVILIFSITIFAVIQNYLPINDNVGVVPLEPNNSIDVGGNIDNSTIIQDMEVEGDFIFDPTDIPVEPILYNVRVEGLDEKILIAYDESASSLWQKEFDSPIRKAIVADLDNSGELVVIVGLAKPGEKSGWLLVFDDNGQLLSEQNTWQESIYYGGAKPETTIVDFEVLDIDGNGRQEIITLADDVYWYPSRVSVFDYNNGKLQQTTRFWNPGLLYTLNVNDVNNDQIAEIVVTGVNNDLQSIPSLGINENVYVVFALSGDQIFGQAPPWFGDDNHGPLLWYGFITPPSTRVSQVDFEDVNGDGIQEFHITLSDVCSYFLDLDGNIVKRGIGTACQGESALNILKFGE